MITLDPHDIGRIDRTPDEILQKERQKVMQANKNDNAFTPKHRTRGRSKSQRRYVRKQINVIDEKKKEIREKIERENLEKKRKAKNYNSDLLDAPKSSSVLDRFM